MSCLFRHTARSQRGFTLIEAILVVGLTSLIAVGVVGALMEGLGSLQQITDRQGIDFGHQNSIERFTEDIQAATWFNNGIVSSEGGGSTLSGTTNPFSLIMGYPGPDGEEVWIRYSVRLGAFTRESYLLRTIATTSGLEGMTILTPGVANLAFNYFDKDGNFTDVISEVKKVQMVLSLEIGGTTVQRMYEVNMRNPNGGAKLTPFDFDEIDSKYFKK
jgi:hypothetical protein